MHIGPVTLEGHHVRLEPVSLAHVQAAIQRGAQMQRLRERRRMRERQIHCAREQGKRVVTEQAIRFSVAGEVQFMRHG